MVFYYHSSHVPAVHGAPSYHIPEDREYYQTMSFGIPNLFSRGNILETPEIFWVAFCKEASSLMDDAVFSTGLQGNHVSIYGEVDVILQIEKAVNAIRELFLMAYQEKKAATILSIDVCSNCFIREKTDIVDLKDWFKSPVELAQSKFVRYIKPCIRGLAEFVGATYSQGVISQKIITCEATGTIRVEEVEAFRIHWIWNDPQPMFLPMQRMTSMKV